VPDERFIQSMRALVAVLAGLIWVVLVVLGIAFSWASGDDPGFLSSDGLIYILPGLTALVGGVVAVAFRVEAPKAPQKLAAGGPKWLGRLYIGAYLLLGLLALLTWIFKGGGTIEYVRTLASAWAGLFLLIASSNFMPLSQPPPPSP
jgi:hypothetical protein